MSVSLSSRVMEQPLEVVNQNQEVVEDCLRKWIVDDKETSVLKKNNDYTCLVVDRNNNDEEIREPLLTDAQISFCLNSQVVIRNGQVYFEQPSERKLTKNNTVRLFASQFGYMWQLFNESTQKAMQFPVTNEEKSEVLRIDPFSKIPKITYEEICKLKNRIAILDVNYRGVALYSDGDSHSELPYFRFSYMSL